MFDNPQGIPKSFSHSYRYLHSKFVSIDMIHKGKDFSDKVILPKYFVKASLQEQTNSTLKW